MIYEVRANLFFTEKADADRVVEALSLSLNRAVVVHPDEPDQEGSSVELIKCYHDETPTKPCVSCGVIKCP